MSNLPTIPGTPFAGGFYLARFAIGAQTYGLIVAPKAAGEHATTQWNGNAKRVAGALSAADGLANTSAMAEAGSALARWARALRIGGHDDWYVPSRVEALLMHAAEPEAPAFQESGAEALARDWYWTSTQPASDPSYAWYQGFGLGTQNFTRKDVVLRARAVRRVAL